MIFYKNELACDVRADIPNDIIQNIRDVKTAVDKLSSKTDENIELLIANLEISINFLVVSMYQKINTNTYRGDNKNFIITEVDCQENKWL